RAVPARQHEDRRLPRAERARRGRAARLAGAVRAAERQPVVVEDALSAVRCGLPELAALGERVAEQLAVAAHVRVAEAVHAAVLLVAGAGGPAAGKRSLGPGGEHLGAERDDQPV